MKEVYVDCVTLAQLRRPIRGRGGFQSLLRRLQADLQGNTLSVSPATAARIERYATRYGAGGFQSRLHGLVSALGNSNNCGTS